MKKRKAYKLTSKWLIDGRRNHKAALSRWYRLGATHGDPITASPPWRDRDRTRHDDLVLYAATLGRKRGELPHDLTGWQGFVIEKDRGEATVEFRPIEDKRVPVIKVGLRWLDWVPGPAVEEVEPERLAA